MKPHRLPNTNFDALFPMKSKLIAVQKCLSWLDKARQLQTRDNSLICIPLHAFSLYFCV